MNVKKIIGIIVAVLIIFSLSSCDVMDLLVAPPQSRDNPLDPDNTLDPVAIQLYKSAYVADTDSIEISWEYPSDTTFAPKTILIIRRKGHSSPLTNITDSNYPDDLRSFISTDKTSFVDTTGIQKETTYWYSIFWSMDVLTVEETGTVRMEGPLSKEIQLVPGVLQTLTLNPIVDGWVNSIGQRDFIGNYLKVNVYTYTEISLLKFDINFQSLDIISSYLKLNVSNMDSMYPRNFNLNRIILDWTKTDLNLYSNFGNSEMYVDTLTSSFNIPMGMTGYYSADVTGIVEDWFQSSANYGFRLKQSSNMSDTDFFSSRSANNNEWPELEINYNGYVLDNDF